MSAWQRWKRWPSYPYRQTVTAPASRNQNGETALVHAQLDDPSPRVRAAALRRALACSLLSVDGLVRALDDTALEVRNAAATLLREQPGAVPAVIGVVRDGSDPAREAALARAGWARRSRACRAPGLGRRPGPARRRAARPCHGARHDRRFHLGGLPRPRRGSASCRHPGPPPAVPRHPRGTGGEQPHPTLPARSRCRHPRPGRGGHRGPRGCAHRTRRRAAARSRGWKATMPPPQTR